MTILIFFVVLVSLILVHEFGHFFVAKKFGIRVDEFGIGFPPKIFGKKYGETEYTVNALPLGGFVRIFGEDLTEEGVTNGPDSSRSFVNQPKYVQIAVLSAGVIMNVLFAFVLYALAYSIGTTVVIPEEDNPANYSDIKLMVLQTMPGAPADEKLFPYDEITEVKTQSSKITQTDNSPISPDKVATFISNSKGEEITFELLRNGKQTEVTITPKQNIIEENPEKFATGFSMGIVGTEKLPIHKAVIRAGKQTYQSLKDITIGMWTLFAGMFKGTSDLSQVTGPVGIVKMVGQVASAGITPLLIFSAFISLNLAVINLLPIPALDGGRILFVLIEAITRKPINQKFVARLNQAGFIALLLLMAIVTYHDILNIF